jgi:hypothetical protein
MISPFGTREFIIKVVDFIYWHLVSSIQEWQYFNNSEVSLQSSLTGQSMKSNFRTCNFHVSCNPGMRFSFILTWVTLQQLIQVRRIFISDAFYYAISTCIAYYTHTTIFHLVINFIFHKSGTGACYYFHVTSAEHGMLIIIISTMSSQLYNIYLSWLLIPKQNNRFVVKVSSYFGK